MHKTNAELSHLYCSNMLNSTYFSWSYIKNSSEQVSNMMPNEQMYWKKKNEQTGTESSSGQSCTECVTGERQRGTDEGGLQRIIT